MEENSQNQIEKKEEQNKENDSKNGKNKSPDEDTKDEEVKNKEKVNEENNQNEVKNGENDNTNLENSEKKEKGKEKHEEKKEENKEENKKEKKEEKQNKEKEEEKQDEEKEEKKQDKEKEEEKQDEKKEEKNQDEEKEEEKQNEENEEKKQIEEKEEEKQDEDVNEEKEDQNEEKKEEKTGERSKYSLEGGKLPLSIYTRRVMDISKINDYLDSSSSKGKCGGHNLGNTCFMNSSIACISNCTELTYYFLKGDYKKDINTENNLGMHGELAKSWGNLLHEYWVENTRVGDPSDFKRTIGQKAVRFRGYNQHDSNEFMSIFLDYLNEDLNRTTKKEYIEMKEKQDNETDEECAKRFWECNLKRNDSIITDLFCGQFKSTITCPQCGRINITFDPFDTINLPMVNRNKNNYRREILDEFKIFYVPKYNLRNLVCLKINNISEDEYIDNAIVRIKKEEKFVYHDKIDKLLIVDVFNRRVHEFISKMSKIKGYTYKNENVFCYDILDKNDDLEIPVFFFENDNDNSKSHYPRIIFGKKDMTLDDLRKKIYFNLRKYILSPLLKEDEEKDSVTLEIEKYMNDEKLELEDEKLFELIEKEYQEVFKTNTEEEKEDKEEDKKENEEEENVKENEEEKKEDKNEENNNNEIKMKDIKDGENKNNEKGSKETEIKNENDKYIEKFKEDMPFKIYLEDSSPNNTILLDNDYFTKLSPKFKRISNLKSFKDSIKDIYKKLKNKIYVEFNGNSKYINKEQFNLDECKNIVSLEYEIKKKEEKKDDEEEEDDGKLTLEKCLKKFCKEEQLGEGNEWYCSKCKNHVLAKKKMELYYLPKILIICFKRFIKESYRWEKNGDNVEFPIENMDMKDYMIGPDREHSKYDLFAVSQHYGSTGFGHYTAVCKNGGKWYSYDDSSCHETNPESCLTSAAYVLFYRRQTD